MLLRLLGWASTHFPHTCFALGRRGSSSARAVNSFLVTHTSALSPISVPRHCPQEKSVARKGFKVAMRAEGKQNTHFPVIFKEVKPKLRSP